MLFLILGILGLSLFVWGTFLDLDWKYEKLQFFSSISGLILIFLTLLIGLSAGLNHLHADVNIQQYDTFKAYVDVVHKQKNNTMERAALTSKIIEFNEEIVRDRYVNDIYLLDFIIPDVLVEHRKLIGLE